MFKKSRIVSYPVSTGGSFQGVKGAEHEANHSPPSNAEAKNAWSYTSTPQYVLMVWCLSKQEKQPGYGQG